MNTQYATFGAGCFWQVEEKFRELDGVVDTAVGYEGGELENPTYEQVCRGDTGHVEVARVEFDPSRIDYADLVQKYFEIHDPTQLNRQGPDVGWQYRSVIFTEDDEQARDRPARCWTPTASASATRSSPRSCPRSRSGAPRSTTSATSRSAGTAAGLLGQLLGR